MSNNNEQISDDTSQQTGKPIPMSGEQVADQPSGTTTQPTATSGEQVADQPNTTQPQPEKTDPVLGVDINLSSGSVSVNTNTDKLGKKKTGN